MRPLVASQRIMQRQCRYFPSGRMVALHLRASNRETWRCPLWLKPRTPRKGRPFHVSSTGRKGQCRFESRCRFLHIDAPGRLKPRQNPAPERSKRPPTIQSANKTRVKNPHFAGRCHKCGMVGHKRVNCTAKDSANATVDLVASARDERSSLQEAW